MFSDFYIANQALLLLGRRDRGNVTKNVTESGIAHSRPRLFPVFWGPGYLGSIAVEVNRMCKDTLCLAARRLRSSVGSWWHLILVIISGDVGIRLCLSKYCKYIRPNCTTEQPISFSSFVLIMVIILLNRSARILALCVGPCWNLRNYVHRLFAASLFS